MPQRTEPLTMDSTSHRLLKRVVSNPSLLNTVNVTHQPDRILVVTVDKYLEPVQSYMRWKKTMGFDYRIVSKSNWTDYVEVSDSIHNIYNQQKIDYLLIVGDHQDVPAGVGVFYLSEGKNPKLLKTDLYYACKDQHSDDYTADVGRGRIPVNSKDEAWRVLNRIKQYQISPSQNAEDYKGIVCGYFEPADGERESRRFILTCEEVKDYLEAKGIEIDSIYYTETYNMPSYYNDEKYASNPPFPENLKRPHCAWDGDYEDIVNSINNHCSFIFYRGHGTDSAWVNNKYPHYNLFHKNNLELLHNNIYPVIFSVCCETGRFDKDCLAELF